MRLIVGRQWPQAAQSYFQPLQLYQGGLILLSAFVLWQHGVRAGAQGQSKVSLPLVVCISLHFYSPIHPSTYPPPIYASTLPPTHSPIHPPTHPSILLLSSFSHSFPLCSFLIYHVPGTMLGPRILAHSLGVGREHQGPVMEGSVPTIGALAGFGR